MTIQEYSKFGRSGRKDWFYVLCEDPPSAPNRGGQMANAQNRWSGDAGRHPARITRGECLAPNAIVTEICGGNAADVVYQSRLGMNPV